MSNETIAEVLARKYSDDDLNVIIQDWDHTDADQAVSIALAADLLRERTSRREKERSLAAGKVEPTAWRIHWSESEFGQPELTDDAERVAKVAALDTPPRIVTLYTAPPADTAKASGSDTESDPVDGDAYTRAFERGRKYEREQVKASGSAPDDEGPEGEDGPWASGWDERSRPTREPFTDGRLQALIDHHETWIASAKESGFADAVTFHTDCLAVIRNLATPPASAPEVTEEMVERAAKVERATTAKGYGWTAAQFETWWNKDPEFCKRVHTWADFTGTRKQKLIHETRIALTAALQEQSHG